MVNRTKMEATLTIDNKKPGNTQIVLYVLTLLVMLLSGCKVDLYTKVNENDANDMLAALLRNGISAEKVAEKKGGKYTILSEKSQLPAAIAILKDHGFPRETFETFGQLFKKEGLISSPLEERVRFVYALSQNVQETLSRIDGVVTARVHIVLPENNPFSDDIKPSSASVFIKYLPESGIDQIKTQIKMIVERSIEGLSYEAVSLVMLPAITSRSEDSQIVWSEVLGYRVPLPSAIVIERVLIALGMIIVALLGAVGYLSVWIRKAKRKGTIEGLTRPVLPEIVSSRLKKPISSVGNQLG